MNETIEFLNFLLALGGVVLLLTTVFLVVDLKTTRSLAQLVRQWGLLIAFIITVGAGAMTLLYSEVFGFVPCGLCWLQRVFMYPQIFMTGTALWIKDKTVAVYGIVLSIPGIIVALYQHYLQMGGAELVACPTAGEGADCAKRILFEFGFLTFPLLSAIMFAFLIVLYIYIIKTKNEVV